MSKLMTYVAAFAIGVAAWNGYDASTKRNELSTTRQQLSVTTENLEKTKLNLQTTSENLNKAQQKLEAIAAEEQKAETNLDVALTQGKNILNGILPVGYLEGTIVATNDGTKISFQGPFTVNVRDLSVQFPLLFVPELAGAKISSKSLYATVLTTQAQQETPDVLVLAGTVSIPDTLRQDMIIKLQNPSPFQSGQLGSYAVLSKGDTYVLVAADQKNHSAVEQLTSALQKKYRLDGEVVSVAQNSKEQQDGEQVKKQQSLETLLHVTDATFEQEVVKANTPVVVDFYADWCGPCKMMAPEYEKVSKEYTGKVKFVKLDIKQWDHPKAKEYHIRSIPTLILFNKGKEVTRSVGYKEKAGLKQFVDDAVKEVLK